ncbi:hypothetical protein GOP47_0012560 [Adiantum capillus-veneris]|uniref:Cytochrome P450 n=1 Tax=Adiantum capillus-veneris TaxID=13818 RepID=A0A9D4UQX1_ADICA|nr:hypothetical protein GOP47_0012560 [Adiantum capillus-veneris]
MEVALRSTGGAGGAAVAAALVVTVVWMASEVIRRGRSRLPPGPWGLPVIGNLLKLVGGELPHRAMARLSKKYGPIVFLKLGAAPTILVSDCDLAKACLSGHNDKVFASRPSMEITRRLCFGQCAGIAMAPFGEEWRQARRLCSMQLFTTRRVNEFQTSRKSEIITLVRRIERQIGDPVNVTQAIATLSESITCKMLLGKSLAEVGDEKLGIDMQMLVHRMTELFHIPIIGDFIPALEFLDRKTKVALDEVHTGFDTLISKLIHERQQRPLGSPQVILDVLLDNLDANRAKTIMMELIGAGIDTSATTLDWAMAELVGNPRAMRRMQEELDGVTKGDSRMIEEEEIGSLVYTKAVLKETMRLHAPVPLLLPHMSTEECYVGGYRIPKGCRLLINVWAIGRDPKSWEEPEKFSPERFLTETGSLFDVRGQNFELLPFGSGRRICPGMPLALPLILSTLVNLVHTFDWHLHPDHPLDMSERFGVVANRAHPLMAIPKLRHSF